MTTTPADTARALTASGLYARKRQLEARREELQQDMEHGQPTFALLRELQDIRLELDAIAQLLPAAQARERAEHERARVIAAHELLDEWETRSARAVPIAAEMQSLIDQLAVKMQELQEALVWGEFRAQLPERRQEELRAVAKDGGPVYDALATQLRLARCLFDEEYPPPAWLRQQRLDTWVRNWTEKFRGAARRGLPPRPDDPKEAA